MIKDTFTNTEIWVIFLILDRGVLSLYNVSTTNGLDRWIHLKHQNVEVMPGTYIHRWQKRYLMYSSVSYFDSVKESIQIPPSIGKH